MKNYLFKAVKALFWSAGVWLLASGCSAGTSNTISEREEAPATVVDQHGQLSVQGITLHNQHGQPVVLRGVSLGWHNWWPRFYHKETVGWLTQDWDISVIRAAIGVGPDGSYLDNPEFALECLYRVVDAAIAEGIYVIVDWHSHEIHTDEAKDFFKKVATKYKEYPNLIYEIYNEPVEDSWAEVKHYAEEVIAEIRKINSEAIILVGCPHWDQDIHLVAEDPIQGHDNIMYTVHFYAATHKQYLRDRTDEAMAKGIPVFISECAGMEATGDGPIDQEEWQRWVSWMADKNISWVAWSIADKNETCSMIRDPEAPRTFWADKDLKEWGKTVRNELKKRNETEHTNNE